MGNKEISKVEFLPKENEKIVRITHCHVLCDYRGYSKEGKKIAYVYMRNFDSIRPFLDDNVLCVDIRDYFGNEKEMTDYYDDLYNFIYNGVISKKLRLYGG